MRSSSDLKKVSLILIFLLIFLVVEYYSYQRSSGENPIPTISNFSDSWQTKVDSNTKVSFKYPTTLPTTYIHPVDWPPAINVLEGPVTCTEGGSETERAGGTVRKNINDRIYCVSKVVGGAAGSIYTQYAYATMEKTKVIIMTFSTQAVQCGNYDDFQKEDCEKERASFDIDRVTDQMISTVKIP